MLKQYVEFFFPGSFVSDTSVQAVSNRASPVVLPKGAYGYRFFAREEVKKDGEILTGKRSDISSMTYYGEALTLEDVQALPGDTRILVGNMKVNGWHKVVRTARGGIYPIEDGDVVLPAIYD